MKRKIRSYPFHISFKRNNLIGVGMNEVNGPCVRVVVPQAYVNLV